MTLELENRLQNSLQQGVVQVKFVKADGSERTMLATTCASLITQPTVSNPDKPRRAATPGVLRVWDTELSAWRSIVLERILSWSPVA
jgi:hypothetical protein